MTRFYGCIPDAPDHRDHVVALTITQTPASVDCRLYCPPIWNQGELGSCTAHGIPAMFVAELARQKLPTFMPSRLKFYYDERVLEHSTGQDDGAQIRDGLKVLAKTGVCDEDLWPYDITKFTDKPPADTVTPALANRAVKYARVPQSPTAMELALAEGQTIAVGFTVFDSFESAEVAKTGVVPMPAAGENQLGGHCVLVVGYDRAAQRFLCRNSWGNTWGDAGHFRIPYAYLGNSELASDFWTISVAS